MTLNVYADIIGRLKITVRVNFIHIFYIIVLWQQV